MELADFIVIGGGIVGINIAIQLKQQYPDAKIVLLEKEKLCGIHASGRNSGVIHAGFYYSPDSLKAKLTRDGNKALTEYCEDRQLPINKCGKLVVAMNEEEEEGLNELLRRGKKNSIDLKKISLQEAREIEPRVKSYQSALFSPTTSSIDPTAVLLSMKKDALGAGIKIHEGVTFQRKEKERLITTDGEYSAGYTVNAAGLYADNVANQFGFSTRYRILPFKGIYLYSNEPNGSLKTNIYPVPNLKNPFLGVHFTLTVTGQVKIGPSAIPAFWRENYQGFENFQLNECIEIILREMGLFVSSNFDFRSLAFEEIAKYSKRNMVKLAGHLVKDVKVENYTQWGKKPGIRAQLFDIINKKLEMDFVVEGDKHSMHILNAVSPAYTCAISFSKFVCDKIHEYTQ